MILNQHQSQAFHFSDGQLDSMEQILIAREALLAELLPWDHPNFGTDEGWIRAYPYEIETGPGTACAVEVRATQHADQTLALTVKAVLPPGWTANYPSSCTNESKEEWIVRARVSITIPAGAEAGSYPIAFRVTWGGRYLGQVCHALVKV